MTISALHIYEVTTILANIIRIEFRDPDINKQGMEAVASPPDAGAYSTWLMRNSKYAWVAGGGKDYYRYEDVRPTTYLDRAACDTLGNWTISGGLTVTAVYRKSVPRDQGEGVDTAGTTTLTNKVASMRHYVYLVLSGDLSTGDYTINAPNVIHDPIYFVFDALQMRCAAIHHNHVGYDNSGGIKQAYFSHWIPGYGTEGRVALAGTTFHIINAADTIVWSGTITLRIDATTTEPQTTITSDDVRLTSTTGAARTVTGYTLANPCVVTYTGDDLANDQIIRIEGCRATVAGLDTLSILSNPDGNISAARNIKVKNVNNTNPLAKTFEVWKQDNASNLASYAAWDMSASTYVYRLGGIIRETSAGNNRHATNVYNLDFTAYTPSSPGVFRIYIPGIGVSHQFRIDDAVWHEIAGTFAAGEYHHRHDVDLDGRFGYTKPAGFSPSAQTIYENLLPLTFSNEASTFTGYDYYLHHVEASTRYGILISGAGTSGKCPGHHDAGDHDSRLSSHQAAYNAQVQFYLNFPDAAEATSWNIPTVESLYPSDTIYDGTAILPDCLQQCMWACRSYLQTLTADNFISGGVNWSTFSSMVPSWRVLSNSTSSNRVFQFAPDHITTLTLVPILARLAVALRLWDTRHSTSTFVTLAQYYEDTAVDMWTAWDTCWDNGSNWGSHSSGAVDTIRTSLYGALKTRIDSCYTLPYDAQTANFADGETVTGGTSSATGIIWRQSDGGTTGTLYLHSVSGAFVDNELITSATGSATTNIPTGASQTYPTNFTAAFNSKNTTFSSIGRREDAAAALYLCTGDITYGNIVTAYGSYNSYTEYLLQAMFDYTRATHANRDTTKQAAYKSSITTFANTVVSMHGSGVGYKMQMAPTISASFGHAGTDWTGSATALIAAYIFAEEASPGSGSTFRDALADGFHYCLGANQLGRSLVTGLGYDPVKSILHNDSQAMGVDTPKGIMTYGPCDRGVGQAFVGGNQVKTSLAYHWYIWDQPTDYTEDYIQQKVIEPHPYAWPLSEHFFETCGMIEMTEYVFGGNIEPQQYVAATLWATCNTQPTEPTTARATYSIRTR